MNSWRLREPTPNGVKGQLEIRALLRVLAPGDVVYVQSQEMVDAVDDAMSVRGWHLAEGAWPATDGRPEVAVLIEEEVDDGRYARMEPRSPGRSGSPV